MTDRAIIGLFGGALLEGGQQLFRIDNFLGMLAGTRCAPIAFWTGYWSTIWRTWAGSYLRLALTSNIINFSDDLGMQTGPPHFPSHLPRVLPAAAEGPVERSQEAVGCEDYATLLRRSSYR